MATLILETAFTAAHFYSRRCQRGLIDYSPVMHKTIRSHPRTSSAVLAMSVPRLHPLISLPPQLSASQKEETDCRLQKIIGANITSRYACSSSHLADFRLAIADKDVKEDSTLSDFRRLVPLTDYEAYRPWMDKFLERPCKLSEVENLFAPGLPSYLGVSSSTSGSKPKHFARYLESNLGFAHAVEEAEREGSSAGTTAGIFSLCYRDIVDVTTESGEVVKRIPTCIGSAGFWRNLAGWPVETDNTRMASMSEYSFDQIMQWMIVDIRCYMYSSRPCCSVGDGSHKSSSIFLANPCLVRIGRSELGANYLDVCYVFHGSRLLCSGRVGRTLVQHTRWGRSEYRAHRPCTGLLTGKGL